MSQQAETVIHDIGYRHYEGPRLGRGPIVRALFTHSLRGAYGLGRAARAKVLPFLLLTAMCVPAVVSVAVTTISANQVRLISYAGYNSYLQLVSVLFVAAVAPQMVSRDLRFRLLPLYFSRPLRRGDYVVAKYAAFATALVILLATPITLLFLGGLLAKLPFTAQAKLYLPALGGAVVLALVLAAIGLAIAAVTPRRGFGVAAIIAVYLVTTGVTTVAQGVATVNGYDRLASYAGLFAPYSLVDGFQVWAFGAERWSSFAPPPGGGLFFGLGVVVVLGGALALLFARYRKAALA